MFVCVLCVHSFAFTGWEAIHFGGPTFPCCCLLVCLLVCLLASVFLLFVHLSICLCHCVVLPFLEHSSAALCLAAAMFVAPLVDCLLLCCFRCHPECVCVLAMVPSPAKADLGVNWEGKCGTKVLMDLRVQTGLHLLLWFGCEGPFGSSWFCFKVCAE